MRNLVIGLLVLSSALKAQDPCDPVLAKNQVSARWEYKADKKSGKQLFVSLVEYNEMGCPVKKMTPLEGKPGYYSLKEWKFDQQQRIIGCKEGTVDPDSSRSYLFSETFAYHSTGRVTSYRKDIYEGEMSQTVQKWEYTYSDNGELRGTTFSRLIVRRDTIINDEIRYDAAGIPAERSLTTYYPKGISEFRKYNGSGLPVESIRYEKGKMISHRLHTFSTNSKGEIESEVISDGIVRKTEKRKYEKQFIKVSILDLKGKLLSESELPLTDPREVYPAFRVAVPPGNSTKAQEKLQWSRKERMDKQKNLFADYFQAGQLVYSELLNVKGLVTEKVVVAETGIVYRYTYEF